MASDSYSRVPLTTSTLNLTFNGRDIAAPMYRHSSDLLILGVTHVFPDQSLWTNGRSEQKTGIVVHHDAGGAPDDIISELEQLQVIYDMHVANGWNGIGYNYVIAPSGRVYHTGHLATHRAHTKGLDPDSPDAKLNETKIGICFMGNYADGKGLGGRAVDPLADRPTENAVAAFKDLVQLCADIFQQPMDVRPHKYWAEKTGESTLCPGDWAPVMAWAGTRIMPTAAVPTPAPPEPEVQEPAPPEPEVPEAESVFVGVRRNTLRELGSQLLTLANNGEK